MRVIIDTRERKADHVIRVLDQKGIKWERRAMKYGDYTFEVDGKSYEKECIVERKANLLEIAGNFTKGRERFETEFCKGMADGCKMILLIEDAKAKNKIKMRIAMDSAGVDMDTRMRKTWRSRFTGKSMHASIKAFKERYNLDLIFCHKLATAGEILRVFEEYLKEEGK